MPEVNKPQADLSKSTNPKSKDGAEQIVPCGQFTKAHVSKSQLFNLQIENSDNVQVTIQDPKLPEAVAVHTKANQKSVIDKTTRDDVIDTKTRDEQKHEHTPVPVTCDPLKDSCTGTKQQNVFLDKCYKDAFHNNRFRGLQKSDSNFFSELFKKPAKNVPQHLKLLREDYALVMFMVHTVVVI